MRQNMWIAIRQLGWQWRFAGRNCCSEIVKCSILTTDVLISPALILTSGHNQNGVLTPTRRTCYNVITYQSSFRYIKFRSTFLLIREFDKTQIVIFIIKKYVDPKLNVFILHVYILNYPITRARHSHFVEREDNDSNYVSWYHAIRMAVEVWWMKLLQWDSE
jgi:hypothetical protein